MSDVTNQQGQISGHDFYRHIRDEKPEWVHIGELPPMTDKKTGITVIPKYMDVKNRQRWAFTSWEHMVREQSDMVMAFIAAGDRSLEEVVNLLRNIGWHIHTKVEKLEINYIEREVRDEETNKLVTVRSIDSTSFCLASCYIRDPFGSDTTEYGFCTMQKWAAFVEKALTKAQGRALRNLGFGTDFAIDMDEKDELLSVAEDPTIAADSPVREPVVTQKEQPKKEQTKQPASAPVATVAPAQEPKAATPKVEPAPVATTNVRAMTGTTQRTKTRLLELVPDYPAIMNWAAGHFQTERPFQDHASEDQAQKLLYAVQQEKSNEHPNLLDTWRAWLQQNTGKTAETILAEWQRDGVNGVPYREFAKQYGKIVPDEAPKTEPQYVEDTDPEGKDFNEEVEAPLEEAAIETLLRPNDPESPTEEQAETFASLMKQLGNPRDHGSLLQDMAAKVGLWTDEAIRKQYLPGLPEGTKGNPKLCWTRAQYDQGIAMIKAYLPTLKAAA